MDNRYVTSDYVRESIAAGFSYACGCGELYRNPSAAWACRKCREYLEGDAFYDREVVDARTGLNVPRPE